MSGGNRHQGRRKGAGAGIGPDVEWIHRAGCGGTRRPVKMAGQGHEGGFSGPGKHAEPFFPGDATKKTGKFSQLKREKSKIFYLWNPAEIFGFGDLFGPKIAGFQKKFDVDMDKNVLFQFVKCLTCPTAKGSLSENIDRFQRLPKPRPVATLVWAFCVFGPHKTPHERKSHEKTGASNHVSSGNDPGTPH